MAILTSKTEVCDVCRNSRRKVKRYRVGQDGHQVAVLLCREHGQFLDELIELGTHMPSQSPSPRVWDLEEIEKLKKAQNKKTAPRP